MMTLSDFVDKTRVEYIAAHVAATVGTTPASARRIMDADFFAAFFSGYYQGDMMMVAGNKYIADIEEEFATPDSEIIAEKRHG